MAETAQSIIKDALQSILVQASEQPIEANEFQTSIRYLNRMMAKRPYSGLGFTDVVNPSDPITIDPSAIDGVIFNLGLALAPQYDISPSPLLVLQAREALKDIRKITVQVRPTQFPGTMPVGSGNRDRWAWYQDFHFYPRPLDIPEDAQELKVNEIDSFSVDFTNYLLDGATITSFTVTPNENIEILSSAESDGVVTFSAKGLKHGHGKVCVDVVTSTGRQNPEQVDFFVKEVCQ